MNYISLSHALNNKENMEVIRNNIKNDDGIDIVNGVDWFSFNNQVADKIYVSGNSYFGFGLSTQHLNICNRDGAMYSLYREEGVLCHYYRFLKIRFEGYTYYGSTDSQYKLIYELFLLDTGDIFINLINMPTNSSYFGSSTILSDGSLISLALILGKAEYISLYCGDKSGVSWSVKHEMMNLVFPFTEKFLLKKENHYYTLINNAISEIEIAVLNSKSFVDYGFNHPESYDFLKELRDYELLNWVDTSTSIGDISLLYNAVPNDQIITTRSFSLDHSSIAGIASIITDSAGSGFQFSFDRGATYEVYNDGWIVVNDVWMSKEQIESLNFDIFSSRGIEQYSIRIKLGEESVLKNIIVNYRNEVK